MAEFATVVVGVDGRPGGLDAIALGRLLIAPRGRLVLANVHRTEPKYAGHNPLPDPRAEALRLLARAQQDAQVTAETAVHSDDWPASGMHAIAEQEHADVLVVGSSHRGVLGRVFIGDDSRAALHDAPCAVGIAPHGYAGNDRQFKRILVGDDGSPESDSALDAARALGTQHGATVKVVSVVALQSVPQSEGVPNDWTLATDTALRLERERLSKIEGVETDVRFGEAPEELASAAEDADLLVIGSRGAGPIGRLIDGSMANHLARHSPCPLLVLPRRVSR